MTIKIHYLVAADYSHLPVLTVRAQPQGFQASFRRLPGRVEEKMVMRWCIKELLEERGMSTKQLARLSGISYKTISRLCNQPFHIGKPATIAMIAQAFALPSSQMGNRVYATFEVKTQYKQTKAGIL